MIMITNLHLLFLAFFFFGVKRNPPKRRVAPVEEGDDVQWILEIHRKPGPRTPQLTSIHDGSRMGIGNPIFPDQKCVYPS